MTNGPDFWADYLYGTSPDDSGISGIGHVYPYIGGDGKTFYCPGTSKSFEDGEWSWWNTWNGTYPGGKYAFGEQGKGTITTYYYRSGMYEKDKTLPDNDARWGNVQNWMRDDISRPTDPFVQNKPMLTCFWRGYNGGAFNPKPEFITHGGELTNLLYTDGSVRTWELIDDQGQAINPVWGWFDAQAYSEAQFDTDNFYAQMPYWWVKAERALRE